MTMLLLHCRLSLKSKQTMMPSLHFHMATKMESKCMFCRGKNILCIPSLQDAKQKEKDQGFRTTFSFTGLPDSLLLHTFQFLDLRSLLIARRVCCLWKRIAEDQQLWKTTNFSCKRIVAKSWIFSLPKTVRGHARIMNLMWSSISCSAFRNILKAFPRTEVLLLQNCRFSSDVEETRKRTCQQSFPIHLKVLDVRNVQDRWFDEYSFPARFPRIEAVAFSQTLPNNWLSILSTSWMPNLKFLHIQNNPCVTETFLQGIIRNAPLIESINVQGCMNIDGAFLKYAVDNLDNLQHIDVNSTRLDGKHLRSINWAKQTIKSLSISFCCKITSDDLKLLLSQLRHLKHFQASFVGWGKSFNDNVVQSITTHQEYLLPIEYLDLQSTFHMSPQALTQLCSRCPSLRNLRIGTIIKSQEDLVQFLHSVPQIEELSLQAGDCSFTANQLILSITEKCKQLKSLYIYNIQFDLSTQIKNTIHNMFSSLKCIRNFFIGGYPHKERNKIAEIIMETAHELNLKVNMKRPRRVIPLHPGCFDHYLNKTVSIPTYKAFGLSTALRRSHDCQLFYQSGLQKLNSARLLRNLD